MLKIKHNIQYREAKGEYIIKTITNHNNNFNCKIIEEQYDGYVYDLTVENNHEFVDACGSVLLHNTDSLFIEEVQNSYSTDKVLHAEPLFIDLIRDLGARRGEREWNFGMGINDHIESDNNSYLVEYEFAPIDRLGVEFELPITLYNSKNKGLS